LLCEMFCRTGSNVADQGVSQQCSGALPSHGFLPF
jgi:hypothetical protein